MMVPFKEILTFFLCHLMGNMYLCAIEKEVEKSPLTNLK
jgi:hypothetical protein